VSATSLEAAIRHRIADMRKDVGPTPHATEAGRALDYHADQIDFLLLTQDQHRDDEASCHPGCPWCDFESEPTGGKER
jgi:hypothetical protein